MQISRKTLHIYAKDERIRYTVMPNKMYDYNDEVYKILNKRKTIIYERVSKTEEQFTEPDTAVEAIVLHECIHDAIYSDI